MKFLCANRIAPDVTPRFAASHLGLYCLPMSHKKDDRLTWEFFGTSNALETIVSVYNCNVLGHLILDIFHF